jgi:hypothetical protein
VVADLGVNGFAAAIDAIDADARCSRGSVTRRRSASAGPPRFGRPVVHEGPAEARAAC